MAEAARMSSTRNLPNVTRRFTLSYFVGQSQEGWLMIYREIRDYWSERRARRRAANLEASPTTHYVAPLGATTRGQNEAHLTEKFDRLEDGEHEQSSSTLAYGLCCVSKMFHAILLYGPGFIFDPRPGLLPSRRFIFVYYLVITFAILSGLSAAKLILEPTLISVLSGLAKSIIQLLAFTTTISEYLIIVYGMGSLLAVVQNCRYMQEFILYHCNIITLPKSFQRRKAVELFLSFYILTLLSKPLFISLMVICDDEQPIQLIHLDATAFALARALTIAITTVGSLLICTSGMLVPYVSTFLVVCSASHLKRLLDKHLARFDRTTNKLLDFANKRNERQNPRILELLDERTRQLIRDYSCETLTHDWPHLTIDHADHNCEHCADENKSQQSNTTTSSSVHQQANEAIKRQGTKIQARLAAYLRGACFGAHREQPIDTPILSPKLTSADLKVWTCQWTREGPDELRPVSPLEMDRLEAGPAQYNSAANSLLFLYKNLLKSISELKGMIAIYEKKFGTFHLIQICLDSLIVAQYITVGLTESRLRNESKPERSLTFNDSSQLTSASGPEEGPAYRLEITPLASKAFIGVLSFIISNIYIFMRCDCLPQCMVKMRGKLFKMNIELARSALRAHSQPFSHTGSGHSLAEAPRRSTLAVATGAKSAAWMSRQHPSSSDSAADLNAADECAELDQVWSLYDQVVRMSELANFKLTPGTYYSKRCLLWIFGRTVSLTLLCIQIVDIYSYT